MGVDSTVLLQKLGVVHVRLVVLGGVGEWRANGRLVSWLEIHHAVARHSEGLGLHHFPTSHDARDNECDAPKGERSDGPADDHDRTGRAGGSELLQRGDRLGGNLSDWVAHERRSRDGVDTVRVLGRGLGLLVGLLLDRGGLVGVLLDRSLLLGLVGGRGVLRGLGLGLRLGVGDHGGLRLLGLDWGAVHREGDRGDGDAVASDIRATDLHEVRAVDEVGRPGLGVRGALERLAAEALEERTIAVDVRHAALECDVVGEVRRDGHCVADHVTLVGRSDADLHLAVVDRDGRRLAGVVAGLVPGAHLELRLDVLLEAEGQRVDGEVELVGVLVLLARELLPLVVHELLDLHVRAGRVGLVLRNMESLRRLAEDHVLGERERRHRVVHRDEAEGFGLVGGTIGRRGVQLVATVGHRGGVPLERLVTACVRVGVREASRVDPEVVGQRVVLVHGDRDGHRAAEERVLVGRGPADHRRGLIDHERDRADVAEDVPDLQGVLALAGARPVAGREVVDVRVLVVGEVEDLVVHGVPVDLAVLLLESVRHLLVDAVGADRGTDGDEGAGPVEHERARRGLVARGVLHHEGVRAVDSSTDGWRDAVVVGELADGDTLPDTVQVRALDADVVAEREALRLGDVRGARVDQARLDEQARRGGVGGGLGGVCASDGREREREAHEHGGGAAELTDGHVYCLSVRAVHETCLIAKRSSHNPICGLRILCCCACAAQNSVTQDLPIYKYQSDMSMFIRVNGDSWQCFYAA